MFKHYLKITLRNLRKYKGYSLINVVGLAIGMACCFLIMLFVQDELSYDRYHEKADRIYRLNVDHISNLGTFSNALTSAPMAEHLLVDFPGIEKAVRFHQSLSEALVSVDEKRFFEKRFFYADASVFQVFTFPLIYGDPKTALIEPFSVVITEDMAKKYFPKPEASPGYEDPVGRFLKVENDREYKVTGVMPNIPEESHFHFDFLASFKSLEALGMPIQSWTNNPFYTFMLLPENSDKNALEAKFPAFIESKIGAMLKSRGFQFALWLQPLTDIHLNPQGNELESGSDMVYVYLFTGIAVLILLIACVNFMNLGTARSTTRAKEVGMRKVVGARRWQLVRQFLGESIFLAFIALLLALLLVELFLPMFNEMIGREISTDYATNFLMLLSLVGLALTVGILAGSYPAFFLSAFNPIQTLQGKPEAKAQSRGPLRFRQLLVVFQFAVSITLIIGTLVVYQQLNYMKTMKLGLNEEQVVVVPMRDRSVINKHAALKSELLTEPGIMGVTFANRPPGTGAFGTGLRHEGQASEQQIATKVFFVEHDYIPTLEIELAAGRNFSKEMTSDLTEAVILNEQAIQELGWQSAEEAIGQRIVWRTNTTSTIIGVVKNYHFQPLHVFMQPLVISLNPQSLQTLLARIDGRNISATLENLRKKWSAFAPDWPFVYSFLDEDFDKLYKNEERFGQIFANFTSIAIFIACLGLFGLAAFSAERRTKEIGVRKALGASAASIILLLSREFTKLVLIAAVISCPIAWVAMNKWLQNFSFSISINPLTLVFAGGLAIVTAFLTISYQAAKASLANPVDALRYE